MDTDIEERLSKNSIFDNYFNNIANEALFIGTPSSPYTSYSHYPPSPPSPPSPSPPSPSPPSPPGDIVKNIYRTLYDCLYDSEAKLFQKYDDKEFSDCKLLMIKIFWISFILNTEFFYRMIPHDKNGIFFRKAEIFESSQNTSTQEIIMSIINNNENIVTLFNIHFGVNSPQLFSFAYEILSIHLDNLYNFPVVWNNDRGNIIPKCTDINKINSFNIEVMDIFSGAATTWKSSVAVVNVSSRTSVNASSRTSENSSSRTNVNSPSSPRQSNNSVAFANGGKKIKSKKKKNTSKNKKSQKHRSKNKNKKSQKHRSKRLKK